MKGNCIKNERKESLFFLFHLLLIENAVKLDPRSMFREKRQQVKHWECTVKERERMRELLILEQNEEVQLYLSKYHHYVFHMKRIELLEHIEWFHILHYTVYNRVLWKQYMACWWNYFHFLPSNFLTFYRLLCHTGSLNLIHSLTF